MKKIAFYSFFILSLLISGCATTAGYEKILNSWIGASEDQLITQWGVPDMVYQNNDKKYFVYSKQNSSYVPGTAPTYYSTYNSFTGTITTTPVGGTSGYIMNYYCKTTFTVDNGVITNWRWQGNSCKAYEE